MAIQDQTLKNTYSGGVNAYGETLGGFGATSAPIIPQNIPSINSSTLTPQPDLSSSLPQPSQPQAQGLNASVPSPQSLIQNAYAPTNTDSKQNDLLTRLATTIGGQQGLTTLTNQYEQQLGVQDLAKKANEASAQLEALNNQSLALQNQYNYTIPNQMQESAFGRGITAGGLAPLQAGELRKNQIQQGIIASQALTAKSLYYAANNNLVLAKDSAEKAAKAQYEQQQIGIDALRAQLEAVKPQLDREEKARALILESELNDRQKQLDYARKDKETILSWAAAATANGATPLQAQEISKANDLNSAFALYAPFAVDPMATQKAILDLEDQRAGIALTKAQTSKVYADIQANKEQAARALQELPGPIQTRVQGIAGQFDGEQAVKSYQTSAEAIDALKNSGITPTDDISRVYAFAKVMDPNSVVREGEYKTVQDYSTALIERFGLKTKRVFNNSGFLTQEARNFMLKTLENRLASSKKAYENIYKEYGRRIDKVTGNTDGTDYITDYGQAFNSNTQDQYSSYRTQLQKGEILVNRGGQAVAITEDELKPTDIKL